jgi:hypothetical protein
VAGGGWLVQGGELAGSRVAAVGGLPCEEVYGNLGSVAVVGAVCNGAVSRSAAEGYGSCFVSEHSFGGSGFFSCCVVGVEGGVSGDCVCYCLLFRNGVGGLGQRYCVPLGGWEGWGWGRGGGVGVRVGW